MVLQRADGLGADPLSVAMRKLAIDTHKQPARRIVSSHVLRLLMDTSAWLEFGGCLDDQKQIVPLRVLMHQGKLELTTSQLARAPRWVS